MLASAAPIDSPPLPEPMVSAASGVSVPMLLDNVIEPLAFAMSVRFWVPITAPSRKPPNAIKPPVNALVSMVSNPG